MQKLCAIPTAAGNAESFSAACTVCPKQPLDDEKEVDHIDRSVRINELLHRALCDSFTLQWQTTKEKGVEKKSPEECSCQN